jgi:hypothetical protein
MTVSRLLAETTSRELTAWQVFFRIERDRLKDTQKGDALERWIDGG